MKVDEENEKVVENEGKRMKLDTNETERE